MREEWNATGMDLFNLGLVSVDPWRGRSASGSGREPSASLTLQIGTLMTDLQG